MSRSAERARGWGVPVPGSDEVIYVWFDALANYLTGLDYGSDETLFWRYGAQQGERSNFVGKGISKFHAIYWPAILLSAGVPLPSSIFVHGYLTVDGRKIGKSAGNDIDPDGLVEYYQTPDALRYYSGELGGQRTGSLREKHPAPMPRPWPANSAERNDK
ncbi:aminoacyl-tRNA synthetase domain-containing protein (plasmid) [Rhizobium gallicum]|uniref:Aminoacyl-tRNA synthetase domain-containing protein n=1 Tax=Rhizobium gallicum TaxID=56730 RepID=A0A1L5NRQ4_9HYPH|nr:aminoacyl-tRNA synthetase domain-containing protein [Rhizobium gallicum]